MKITETGEKMPKQNSFINRKSELFFVDKLIREWATLRFLFIGASGGIGKTALLQKIFELHKSGEHDRFLLTNIIDFDDRSLHVAENLGLKIADLLDKNSFKSFIRHIDNYRKMERAGISHDRLTREFEEGTQCFINCFNSLSNQKRIVVLLDTIEKIDLTDYFTYIAGVFKNLNNSLIILSGRNAHEIGYQFQTMNKDIVSIINLPKLDQKASQEYLQKKQDELHVLIDRDLSEKLIACSDGKPIIIDLAVEWLAKNSPPKWMFEHGTENITSQWKEFERQLVINIVQTRSAIDNLILTMSRVYPLDPKAISVLLHLTDEESEKLFQHAHSNAFVKALPDGRITLHDEMRRMVNEYVWPIIDPDGDRQRAESKLAASYFNGIITSYENEIKKFDQDEKNARQRGNIQDEIDAFSKQVALEREVWILKAEHLKHTLIISVEQGVKTFINYFDGATESNKLNSREALLIEIHRHSDSLSEKQRFQVDIRRARSWHYKGNYGEEKNILEKLIAKKNEIRLFPQQVVELLIELGNAEIRLASHRTGIENFEQAVEICRHNNYKEQGTEFKEWAMRSLLALGYGYRVVGNYDRAIVEYNKAYELSILLGNRLEQAKILNNMAYAHANCNNNTFGALNLAEQARELWQNDEKGLGSLYLVYSEIHRIDGRFTESIEDCENAVKIFESLNDNDWLNKTYLQRASSYFRRADFKRVKGGNAETIESDLNVAETDLIRIVSSKIPNSKNQYEMEALHYLGHVNLTKYHINNSITEYLERAEECFKQAYYDSKEASFNILHINTLGDWANVAIIKNDYNSYKFFKDKYKNYKTKWDHIGFPKDFHGLMLKYLGDLSLYQTNFCADETTDYYYRAISMLIYTGRYSTFSLDFQLKDIDQRLNASSQFNPIRMELGKILKKLWEKDLKIGELRPEARTYFICWERGVARNV